MSANAVKTVIQLISITSPKETKIDRFPLLHPQERRLIPDEIKAIKDMQTNPHIPEDAKPPLPEGY